MNKKGVTLVELIVVFVIIAIMAGLMAPNMGAWLPSYRLRTATRDIASTFRGAQMRAVAECKSYTVSFGTRSYVYAGTSRALPPGITIVSNTLPGSSASFNPDSTCPSAGSITLQNTKGSQKKITILSSTGKVTIQ